MKRHQNGREFNRRLGGEFVTFTYRHQKQPRDNDDRKDDGESHDVTRECVLDAAQRGLKRLHFNVMAATAASEMTIKPTTTLCGTTRTSIAFVDPRAPTKRRKSTKKRKVSHEMTDGLVSLILPSTALMSGKLADPPHFRCHVCDRLFQSEDSCREHCYQSHVQKNTQNQEKKVSGRGRVDDVVLSNAAAAAAAVTRYDGGGVDNDDDDDDGDGNDDDYYHDNNDHDASVEVNDITLALKPSWSRAANPNSKAVACHGDQSKKGEAIDDKDLSAGKASVASFLCPLCGVILPNGCDSHEGAMALHLEDLRPKTIPRLDCTVPGCDASFADKRALLQHCLCKHT